MPKTSADLAAIRTRAPDMNALSALTGANNANGGNSQAGTGPLQLYTAGFDATWEIDLFGGTRRAIEAASAQAEAVDADLADTQVSIAAEVANAYVDLRDQQQRLALSQRTAELQQQQLDLTQQRRGRGVAADADIERLTTQVENTRASLIPLDAQVTESLDRLATLTGRAPGALDAQLSGANPALPSLPASVPIGDPATLLKQRPDMRAAERRLASSNAQIGEHVADYFPKVTLLGDLGFSAADPGHLFRKQNWTWVGAPYLQWNLFDFGRTRGAVRAAEASRDEAEANYTKAVLGALQDANTALSRYGHQRDHVVALDKVQTSAVHSATLMDQRYRAGVSLADRSARHAARRAVGAAERDRGAGRADQGLCVPAEEPRPRLAERAGRRGGDFGPGRGHRSDGFRRDEAGRLTPREPQTQRAGASHAGPFFHVRGFRSPHRAAGALVS